MLAELNQDKIRLLDFVKSYNWQQLALFLKNTGSARCEHLVTMLFDEESFDTAFTLCVKSFQTDTHTMPDRSTNLISVIHRHEDTFDSPPAGLLETCQVLLKFGSDLNHKDRTGHSALHWSIMSGDPQLVALLLSSGADVASADGEGHTVLHTAIVAGKSACVAMLLQHDKQVFHIYVANALMIEIM